VRAASSLATIRSRAAASFLALHRVATHDVPAVVDDDLLDFEIVGDRPVAAAPRQDLRAELLCLRNLHPTM
jgi:hypothetical protein